MNKIAFERGSMIKLLIHKYNIYFSFFDIFLLLCDSLYLRYSFRRTFPSYPGISIAFLWMSSLAIPRCSRRAVSCFLASAMFLGKASWMLAGFLLQSWFIRMSFNGGGFAIQAGPSGGGSMMWKSSGGHVHLIFLTFSTSLGSMTGVILVCKA